MKSHDAWAHYVVFSVSEVSNSSEISMVVLLHLAPGANIKDRITSPVYPMFLITLLG